MDTRSESASPTRDAAGEYMRPVATRRGLTSKRTHDGLTLTTADGASIELPAVTAAVWQAADGRTDLAGLLAAARAVDAAADEETVWSALDALGDAGLLEGRAAPPAAGGVDRRTAIRSLAMAAGAVLAIVPALGRAEPAAPAAPDARKAGEENIKLRTRAEQEAKASLTAAEARAQESAKKAEAAAAGDQASARKQEQNDKLTVDEARKKNQEQMDKLADARTKNQEQMDKLSGGRAKNQEQMDKASGGRAKNQEQNDKAAGARKAGQEQQE